MPSRIILMSALLLAIALPGCLKPPSAHRARTRRHAQAERSTFHTSRHERRLTMNNIGAAAIPFNDVMRYPKNWDQVVSRAEKGFHR
jgi:hypothetical protein